MNILLLVDFGKVLAEKSWRIVLIDYLGSTMVEFGGELNKEAKHQGGMGS